MTKKITELSSIESLSNNDLFIVDDSVNVETKSIKYSDLQSNINDLSLYKKKSIVIDDFQTEDWVHESGGTATVSYDTSDFISGTKSLKVVTNGDGTDYSDFLNKDISITIDPEKHNYFEIDIKAVDAEHITRFYMYLYSDITENKYLAGQLEATGRKNLPDGSWVTFRAALHSFEPSGEETHDSIGNVFERVRFRISDDETAVTLNLNGLRLVEQLKKTYILLTFDDSNKSTFTKAMPIMEKYGIKGTAFNIKENVGSTAQYMTLSDLKVLEGLGWSNALHGQSPDSDGWENLTEEELTKYLTDSVNYWKANDITSALDCVAYPNGNFGGSLDHYIYRTVKKFCKIGRGTHVGVTEPYDMPTNPLVLHTGQDLYLTSLISIESIIASLESLVELGGLAIIPVHDIVDSGASGNDFLTEDFETVVEKLNDFQEEGSAEIITVAQLRNIITSGKIEEMSAFHSYIGYPDATGTDATVQSSERSWFREVLVNVPIKVSEIGIAVTVQSGNICLGIYNEVGKLLATTGSVSCPAVGAIDIQLTSSVILQKGRYYLALVADNTTAEFRETATYLLAGSFSKDSHFPLADLAGRVDAETESSSRGFAIVAK